MEDSSAPSTSTRSSFEAFYKNQGLTSSELRKRRGNEAIRIRKEKRDETRNKRRHIVADSDEEMAEETDLKDGPYDFEVFDESLIDDLNSYVSPGSEERVLRALVFYRHLIENKDHAVSEILSLGLTTIFIDIINSVRSPRILYESVHILSEIACLADGNDVISSNPAIFDQLVTLLSSHEDRLQEVAASAVSNIASDCSLYCIERGLIESILTLYDRCEEDVELRANLVWIARNLCKKKLAPETFEKLMQLYPLLVDELCRESAPAKVTADAAMALALLGDQTDERIARVAVEHRRIMPKMLEMMELGQPTDVRQAAVRYVSNLASGDDAQTDLVCQCALPSLREILADSSDSGARRDACWAISNIAAVGRERVEALLQAGVFAPIVRILDTGSFDLRKEAAWAIFNATQYGSLKQIAFLCRLNMYAPLVDLLTTVDWSVVCISLRAIRRLLEMGESDKLQRNLFENRAKQKLEEEGFRDRLDFLQNCDNKDVSREAAQIWKLFFEDNDDDEMI
ncbi:hypothetical protein QR680_005664 [Steinernema hermaphroditum]|uniref:Importin subunit alpha n=1 Tax=Steinernema hermaphroditum TaxID=289476 RepID=A0AA39HSX7_9BILA|nr:hypothetical protein QR680_005664 [Steinernema hermaphroditum]